MRAKPGRIVKCNSKKWVLITKGRKNSMKAPRRRLWFQVKPVYKKRRVPRRKKKKLGGEKDGWKWVITG